MFPKAIAQFRPVFPWPESDSGHCNTCVTSDSIFSVSSEAENITALFRASYASGWELLGNFDSYHVSASAMSMTVWDMDHEYLPQWKQFSQSDFHSSPQTPTSLQDKLLLFSFSFLNTLFCGLFKSQSIPINTETETLALLNYLILNFVPRASNCNKGSIRPSGLLHSNANF